MGQDKSEIPKQLDYFSGTNYSERSTAAVQDENSVGYWLQNDARAKLQEAYSKLGLDNQRINGKHLLSYSIEDLVLEKKKVKNELKSYDIAFQSKFGRIPNRSEKEPMRHVYMYYKRLKQALQKQ